MYTFAGILSIAMTVLLAQHGAVLVAFVAIITGVCLIRGAEE